MTWPEAFVKVFDELLYFLGGMGLLYFFYKLFKD